MFGIFYFSSFVTRHSSFVFHCSTWNLYRLCKSLKFCKSVATLSWPPETYLLRIIIFYFKIKIYKNILLKLTLLQLVLSVIFKKWYKYKLKFKKYRKNALFKVFTIFSFKNIKNRQLLPLISYFLPNT